MTNHPPTASSTVGVFQQGSMSRFQLILAMALCSVWSLVSCGGGSSTPPPPTLQSISVSPQTATVAAGLTQQYSASGNYSDGSSKPLTPLITVTWTTSDTTSAKVDSTGLVTTIKQGSITVSAASGSVTGSASLTIGPPTLATVSVSPANPTVFTGGLERFTATGTYTDGSTQDLSNVSWSSGTPTVASVNKIGLATGLVSGMSAITATSGGVSGSTTLTVAQPVYSTLTYSESATFSSGGMHPKGVVVADFNGDGKPDIAVSDFDTNSIAVFLNNGSGGFGTPVTTSVQLMNGALGLNIGALSVGDFNEDGKPDLVVGTIAGGQVSIVLLGNGDGTFSQQPPIPNSFGFLRAKVVDLNGDGHQDLVFAENGNISVSLGKGDGTFGASVGLPAGSFPGAYFGLAVADFNGDGKLDIVGEDLGNPNAGVGKLDFYAGNGDGTFANPTSVNTIASAPGSLANGDFNGDGKQDVLIGFPNAGIIFFGNGDGTFNLTNPEFVYSTNSTNTSSVVVVLAADLTNKGKSDAVTADFETGTLQIALNSALGQIPPFTGIYSFALSPGLADIAVGDLNGDGILDVVAMNYQTGQITVVLSKTQ